MIISCKMKSSAEFTPQVIYLALIMATSLTCALRFVGDKCKLADGVSVGTCLPAMSCPYLKTIPKNDWVTCSFDRNNPIVCCRENASAPAIEGSHSQSRLSGKSERMCDRLPKVSALINHIFNGQRAAVNEFPHVAALGYPKKGAQIPFLCGASLISERFLLTAGHCLSPEEPVLARLGIVHLYEDSPEDAPIDIAIKNVFIHPNYTSRPLNHDIALLELNTTTAEYPYLIPACLYTAMTDPNPDVILSIEGWGSTDPNDIGQSHYLLKANVTTIKRSDCNSTLARIHSRRSHSELQDGQLCALGRSLQNETTGDTCVGDSGGPLELIENQHRYVVGVTSSGKLCGSIWPGIYTRVSRYVDWIESIVWPN